MADNGSSKSFYKKWWFWVIIVVLVFGIAGAAGGGGSGSGSGTSTGSSGSSGTQSTTNPDAIAPSSDGSTSGSSSSAVPSTPAKKTFGVGDTQTSGKATITLLGFRESTGSSWNAPDDGEVFVIVEFEISNLSEEDLTISSLLCFEGFADGYKLEYDFGAEMETEGSLDGTIDPGRKLKGEIGFGVPVDWKTLEVDFQANVYSSKTKVTFTIEK